MRKVHHYINGAEVPGCGGGGGDVFNPATGELQARVDFAGPDDVDKAVAAAREAFAAWAATPILKRASILFRFRELLEANRDKLCETLVKEHGKVWNDAMGELSRGFEVVEFACGIPQLLKGEYSEQVGTGIDTYSIRQPLGVVAAITPFNFPAMVPLWTAALAIACGNAYVLKPSEKDPSSANLLAKLFKEAGLPAGVFNVVHGDKVAVDSILEHPDIKAVSFVGSTPVAEYVYHTGCARNKRVQALGGAKNHAIVMPDADLDQAVEAIVGAAYGSSGERCMALSVAVAVGDETGDALIKRLIPRIREIKIGHGLDRRNEMGPLITAEHCAKVRGHIDHGVEEGAKLVLDGRDVAPEQGFEGGFWLGPTLFDDVKPDMSIYTDEIFGPVLCVVRARDHGDAFELVRDNPYGNGTCIFTRDGNAARTFANEINIGMVGINVPLPVPLAFYSFGGWKSSLFGDHHMYGAEGVRFFTRLKTVTARWPTSVREGVELSFPSMK